MKRSLRRVVAPVLVLLLAVLALGIGGCFNPFAPLIATTTSAYVGPPEPNSAENVIRLFAWCWNNMDMQHYEQLFTADFQFVFALGDSAGNLFRDPWVDRAEELTIARNLFVGGSAEPRANSISLTLDATLNPMPDTRPGKNSTWHKEIVTGVDLSIKTDAQEYRIQGNARFFVVRGDSAVIPAELGLAPDAKRWWIERWNDETMQGVGARAAGTAGAGPAAIFTVHSVQRITRDAAGRRVVVNDAVPSQQLTWGQLMAIYSGAP